MWGADVNVGGLEVGFETTSNFETLSVFGAPGHYVWFAAPPPIGYTSHSNGTVRLTDHPITVGVVFHVAPGYSLLKVRESGLPSGSAWSVVVNGTTPATDAFNTTATTNSSSVTVLVFDGTYDFTVPSVPGYFPSPSSGSLAITGGTTLHVRFHIVTYALVFSETGIPAGRSWSVRITGPVTGGRTVTRTLSSRGSSITFEVPNGTYWYTILAGRPHRLRSEHGFASDQRVPERQSRRSASTRAATCRRTRSSYRGAPRPPWSASRRCGDLRRNDGRETLPPGDRRVGRSPSLFFLTTPIE